MHILVVRKYITHLRLSWTIFWPEEVCQRLQNCTEFKYWRLGRCTVRAKRWKCTILSQKYRCRH